MKIENIRLALATTALASLLCVSHTAAFAQVDAASKDYITQTDQNMSVSGSLNIIHPSEDIKTVSEYYYITGSSNIDEPLYCNGEEVQYRGIFGSFGEYVALDMGENVFKFKNGGETSTITITRVSSPNNLPTSTTKVISSMTPAYDEAVEEGTKLSLKCVAPSGASVWATLGGKTVNLKQVASASDGVPAVFRGEITVPYKDSSSTVKLGKVEYGMKYNGSTSTKTSGGVVYCVGSETKLVVEVIQQGAITFSEASTNSSYVTTLRNGSTDYVTDTSDTMYKLSMGGWIKKDAVQPIEGNPSYKTTVSGSSYREDEKSEEFVLETNGKPSFKATQTSDKITIKLYNTRGLEDLSTKKSSLISSADVEYQNGDTTITFNIEKGEKVWGYYVYYNEGETVLQFRYPPKLSRGSRPLLGVKVALDPGHGGSDCGALGIQWLNGPSEATINLATAQAVQKQLEYLGADVVMTRTSDKYYSLDERAKVAAESKADIFISLHCNSIGLDKNSNKSYGTEVYYHEPISKALSDIILAKMGEYTSISIRKVMRSYYKITLNSYAPSMLVEMGFMTNPMDYDRLISRTGRYKTALAISDAIVDFIGQY